MRVATMSPAAQRLATAKLGIRIGTDKALKAAYTPSPRPRPKATPTPTRSKSVRSSTTTTPRITTPKLDESMTDDLLNIPSSSSSSKGQRPRAADFI